ncbi:cysteine-rich receptor-like protein kinase 29 [Juglans microcarpa x Juglans regia]|uniref:cysteine-rich receptor-like protein kinase 29 n=1 Tax=Juglans microcarpa x Juglans regia TaxID=2249226 RepID=UPI001B7EF16E|nr:cysteine-rich receptor-like protein kinase 29 [Juglans microcarpa x Juglans regia]
MASTIPLMANILTKYMQLDFVEGILSLAPVEVASKTLHIFSNSCPNKKEAIGWFDECMLCYSNCNIFGRMQDTPEFFLLNIDNASAPVDQFNQDRTLLDSLKGRAASGGSQRKFALGNATEPNFKMLHALVQCTPDLSEHDCSECLFEAIGKIPDCCEGKLGERVVGPSCSLDFEIYIFYNVTANINAPPLLPPPSPQPMPRVSLSPSFIYNQYYCFKM